MRHPRKATSWWLYVLECEGGVLYTGVTTDVATRFEAHARGRGARFMRLKRPVRILATALVATKGEALRAEHAFKQLSRAEKLRWSASGLEQFVERILATAREL